MCIFCRRLRERQVRGWPMCRAVNDDVAIASVIDEFGEVSTMLAVELEQRRLLDANSQPVNGEASVVALAGRRTGRTACARRGARACRGRRGFGGFLDGGQHADVVDHDQVGSAESRATAVIGH